MTSKPLTVAVVGATGVVGRTMIQVLNEREFVGSQVVYTLSAFNGAEIRVIVQEPFGALEAPLGSTLDLFWLPEDGFVLPEKKGSGLVGSDGQRAAEAARRELAA